MTPFASAILAILLARPIFTEDRSAPDEKRAQLELVAPAIAEASHEDPFIAALLIAVGDAETHWSLRIWRNECRVERKECDAGRARGLTQLHRSSYIRDEQWEALGLPTYEGTLVAMKFSAQLLRYGRRICGPVPDCVLRVFAGKSPRSDWAGLQPRLATFQSARARL